MKNFLSAFLLFGLVMGLMFGFQTGNFIIGLVVGILGGAAFSASLGIFIFAVRRFRVFGMKEIEGWAPGEQVVKSGDANIMRRGFAEGGRLFLTGTRLRFCAHRAGLEVGDLSFPLTAIASVERCRTLGIVPNGVRVALTDGRKVQFVVSSPGEWIDAITQRSARRVQVRGANS